MSQQSINLSVLGTEIVFRPGADMERVKRAADLVEERFAGQKIRSHPGQSKDILLTFLALGLADDLLQMKNRQGEMEDAIRALLDKIEKSL